ncbi:hypothetical protein [Psychroflexus aestuariivivens]|uniref:hypothetical protein n=1 Tax=Psychroflexus aestuariivivens TaxID=1795040 RepID=UPI000FD9BF9D|nr:hypothetical protein [Psychroflexus aestuariivivens]
MLNNLKFQFKNSFSFKIIFFCVYVSFFGIQEAKSQDDLVDIKSKSSALSEFEVSEHWLTTRIGLNFFDTDFAAYENPLFYGADPSKNFGISVQPQLNVFIHERISAGLHLGYAYQTIEGSNPNFNQYDNNYQIGLQLNYYVFRLEKQFYVSGELMSNYNYLTREIDSELLVSDQDFDNIKTAFNLNISWRFRDNFIFSLVFYEIFTHNTNDDNFQNYDQGLAYNNFIKHFIEQPQFNLSWRLF